MARSSIARSLRPLGVELLLGLFALNAERVLDLALLGEQLDLLDSGRVIARALLGLDLGQPGLDRREGLELLERNCDGLGDRRWGRHGGHGGRRATIGGFRGHRVPLGGEFPFSVFSVRFHH